MSSPSYLRWSIPGGLIQFQRLRLFRQPFQKINPQNQSVSQPRVHYDHITTQRDLDKFCQDLAGTPSIAFDTEFVSEHSYRPVLCLIQVAAGDRLAVIDPTAVGDVTGFWELLATPGHETLVHAGREELLFSLGAVGRPPHSLFDIQIAAGLVGFEYPAGYGSLLFKLFGERLHKGETRTDWRRRPLTPAQLRYALDDVRYLLPLADMLRDGVFGDRFTVTHPRHAWILSATEGTPDVRLVQEAVGGGSRITAATRIGVLRL